MATQTERTEATRTLLIEAALELLETRGWAATTSVAVCGHAGLTRGALVHHFGGLPGLLADALDAHHTTLAASVPFDTPPRSLEDLVERTWRVMENGRIKIVIEAWLAAGNDPELAATVGPVIERFAKLVSPTEWPTALPDDQSRALYLTLREAMFGLALGRATSGRPLDHEPLVVEQLIELARRHDQQHGATT